MTTKRITTSGNGERRASPVRALPSFGHDAAAEVQERATSCELSPDNWFVAARSDQLKGAPLSRTILGRSLVLYRTAEGGVVAMEDRCPHKNVALSMGRVHGDSIQCLYHGWMFDPSGACVDVPCHSPAEKLPRCAVPTYASVEQDDWIWVHLGDHDSIEAGPPRYPKARGYGWFELHNVMRAPIDLILENGFDCSHTGFAHEGLFRSAPKNFITARIEQTPTGVRVETLDEKSSEGKDARSLLGKNKRIRHIDELILPHTVKVDYWLGKTTHIVTILVCTPEDQHTTRVYTRMGVRYPGLTWPVTAFIYLLTRKVVSQDKAILHSQAERIRRFGQRAFRATVADQPATWLLRTLRDNNRGKYPPTQLGRRNVVYKL